MAVTADWANRYGIVSGGSSGLGLHLVLALAKQGSHVGILGRDPERLLRAENMAIEHGAASVKTFSIDLSVRQHPTHLISPLASEKNHFDELSVALNRWLDGRELSLLINAIGKSDRGTLEKLSALDLELQFNDNVLACFNMTRLVLEQLKLARGCVVNIGSLAGIIATPNMGGYSVAKAALTAMTRQWRQEMRESGVHFLLVSPGPIQRDDNNVRYTDLVRTRGLSTESSGPGGGTKLNLLDPDRLATEILDAAARRKYQLTRPRKAAVLAALSPIWPSMADWILLQFTKR